MSKQKTFHELSSWSRKRQLRQSLGFGLQQQNDIDELHRNVPTCTTDVLGEHQRHTSSITFETSNSLRTGNVVQPETPSISSSNDGYLSTAMNSTDPVVLQDSEIRSNEITSSASDLDESVDTYCDDYYRLTLDYSSSSDSDTDDDSEDSLRNMIIDWTAQYNISQNALTSLLNILHSHHPDLPRDARTLLKDRQSVFHVRDIQGGQFCYVGLAAGIQSQLHDLNPPPDCNSLTLSINIDGLPLFKSSNTNVWPILALINESKSRVPFVIALFTGNGKPTDLDEFLGEFVEDINKAERHGLTVENKLYYAKIISFVCDAPARALLKNIKGHSGYSACERCVQRGTYRNGRMAYSMTDSLARTNIKFNELDDKNHHHGPTPLSRLNVGLVSNFVLDYMHLVCLGVVRRLIGFWTKGPLKFRQGRQTVMNISQHLIGLQPYMPTEFVRKPRGLNEVDRWKATEFRQFLIYYGPVVLKGRLPVKLYQNFVCLTTAIYMLLSPVLVSDYCDYAKQLLLFFVQSFEQIYGSEFIVYNVHGLIHIADDAKLFGQLDLISAFPFENFLGQIKKLVRKPQHVVTQVLRRLSERSASNLTTNNKTKAGVRRQHCRGPVLSDQHSVTVVQYKELYLSDYCIKINDRDNCVIIDDCVCVVRNILIDSVRPMDYILLVNKFLSKDVFFSYAPITSDLIGMFKVHSLSNRLEVCHANNIVNKCILMPLDGYSVAATLLHTG